MTTPLFKAFMEEYKALCIRHKVHITANMFDTLEVWPLGDHKQIEPEWFDDWTSTRWTTSLKGKNDALGS